MERNRTPARERPVSEVLASARENIRHAEIALDDLRSDDEDRKMHGLRNVIMQGRAATWPLRVLGEKANPGDEHTAWYQEHVANRLKDDQVAHFFVELRNLLEKEGILETEDRQMVVIDHLDMDQLMREGPDGTMAVEVYLDGTVKQFHPGGVAESKLDFRMILQRRFAEAPEEIARFPVEDLADRYLDTLREIVAQAETDFGQLP